MKSLILAVALSLACVNAAFAKPGMVKGTKCIACHTEVAGKKTNVSEVSQEMQKKFADKKCADCHGATPEGNKLTCTDPTACKK